MSNKIIVLCGGASTGKDTTMRLLKEKFPKFQTCVSHTTRPMRKGETEGVEYYFTEDSQFEAMYDSGQFIEIRDYTVITDEGESKWYYGLSESEVTSKLKQGHILVILDLNGLKELKEYYLDSEVEVMAFYIDVDMDTRIKRYLSRDDITLPMVKECVRRLEKDEMDFEGVRNYATVINNPPTSEMTAYAIENYLVNRGLKLN